MAGKRKKNKQKEDIQTNLNGKNKRLKYLKTRRNIRQAQVHISRLRIIARLAATIILFFGIYKFLLLPGWFISPIVFSFYPNYSLMLEGNSITNEQQVLEALNSVELPRKPIYLLDTKNLENALLRLEPVKKVYIRRFAFPGRLKIVIHEKVPIISITPNEEVNPIAVFANDSTIISRKYLPLKEDLTYHVLTYDDYTLWTPKHVEYLAKLCKTIEVYSKEPLVYLDIRNPDDVIAKISSFKLRIGALNDTVSKRVKKVSAVMEEAIPMKNRVNYIDLRWNKSTYIKLRK